MKLTKTLSNFVILATFCCLAGMLNGCATKLPAYSAVANRIPPLQSGYARIYFYTMVAMDPGGGIAYRFSADGKTVGKLFGFQVLFVDHTAGSVKVTLNSAGVWPASPQKDLVLNLAAGETRYVQGEPEPGSHLYCHLKFNLMDPDQAVQDINHCFYVGYSLPVIQTE